jgi:hypothetical protein
VKSSRLPGFPSHISAKTDNMTGIFCKFLAPAAYSKKELRETQHIAAADAVNVGVSSLFGIELKENYRKHSNGAPYIQGYDDIFISVAHSHLLATAAVSDSPVGIDCELIRKIDRRINERFLGGVPDDDALSEWMRREAGGKLLHLGFCFDRSKIESLCFYEFNIMRPDGNYALCLASGYYNLKIKPQII